MSRILVVDDEPQILKSLSTNLRARQMQVDTASTGEEALKVASRHPPDLVILDLGLPGIDGLEVIRGLRGWTSVPIIVLSVRDQEVEKVAALEIGADDYITKPFGMAELIARVRVALRRNLPAEDAVIRTPDFEVDLGTKTATARGEPVHLTPTQWHIIEVLLRAQGKLVTQTQLLRDVWGPNYEKETSYLRVFISQIRSKLEPDPSEPQYFITEPGMGYRFIPTE